MTYILQRIIPMPIYSSGGGSINREDLIAIYCALTTFSVLWILVRGIYRRKLKGFMQKFIYDEFNSMSMVVFGALVVQGIFFIFLLVFLFLQLFKK